jgi:hypothetical protein
LPPTDFANPPGDAAVRLAIVPEALAATHGHTTTAIHAPPRRLRRLRTALKTSVAVRAVKATPN